MSTLVYPTNHELRGLNQNKLPVLTLDDPLFEILPIDRISSSELVWEQMDDFVGLQTVRGYNNEFVPVQKPGVNRFVASPGVFGERVDVDERELTERRAVAQHGQPVDITDLVLMGSDMLLQRRVDRMRTLGWSMLTNGTVTVTDGQGRPSYTFSWNRQLFDSVVGWGTPGTSTPIADLRAVKNTYDGRGAAFGTNARAYMNQATANQLLANTNAADFGGRRTSGGNTINNIGDFNRFLLGDDLPEIVVYNYQYQSAPGTWVYAIPDGRVVVSGYRADVGRRAGAMLVTRNANAPGMQGDFFTAVRLKGEDFGEPPVSVSVYDGWNGGPVLMYGRSVVIMDVS